MAICNYYSSRTSIHGAAISRLRSACRAFAAGLMLCAASPVGLSIANAADRVADPDIIDVRPFPAGGDFQLQSARGPAGLTSMRGQVVLMFFGYITCPDICPTTLGTLHQAATQLTTEERQKLRIAFISVDPERDTPTILDAYTAAFPIPAVGLTGPKAQIDTVADRYGAQYARIEMPGSALRYGIEHSAAVYLIDPRGRLRMLLRHTASPARYAYEIRRLLRGA